MGPRISNKDVYELHCSCKLCGSLTRRGTMVNSDLLPAAQKRMNRDMLEYHQIRMAQQSIIMKRILNREDDRSLRAKKQAEEEV